MSGKSD